ALSVASSIRACPSSATACLNCASCSRAAASHSACRARQSATGRDPRNQPSANPARTAATMRTATIGSMRPLWLERSANLVGEQSTGKGPASTIPERRRNSLEHRPNKIVWAAYKFRDRENFVIAKKLRLPPPAAARASRKRTSHGHRYRNRPSSQDEADQRDRSQAGYPGRSTRALWPHQGQ